MRTTRLAIIAALFYCFPAVGEGDSSPPLDFSLNQPKDCATNPCAPGCQLSCDHHPASRESCEKPNHFMVDWSCSTPCSCSDGVVTCSISYRCTDDEAIAEKEHLPVKPRIRLAIPLSTGLPTP